MPVLDEIRPTQITVLLSCSLCRLNSHTGHCLGANTAMLSPDQWQWFEKELERQAEVTVIASGIQVLLGEVASP